MHLQVWWSPNYVDDSGNFDYNYNADYVDYNDYADTATILNSRVSW